MKIWAIVGIVEDFESFGAYQDEQQARNAFDKLIEENPNLDCSVIEMDVDIEVCLLWDEDNDLDIIYGSYSDAIKYQDENPEMSISLHYVG